MDKKYFLLRSASPFPREELFALLVENEVDARDIEFLSSSSLLFKAEVSFYPRLSRISTYFKLHYPTSQFSILIAHRHSQFEDRLLESAIAYFPYKACYPNEVIMKEIGYDNYSSYGELMDLFRPAYNEKPIYETGVAYLACGLDASLAAKSLFLHRNTFNYRLNQFKEKTGVDLRDFHNAQLFSIYLSLRGKR